MSTIKINEVEYPLATSLRVAYVVQGQNNHKPYMEIFKTIDSMPIEDQIGVIYAAFSVANRNVQTINLRNFTDYFLDNYDLKYVLEKLQEIISGITGMSDTEEAASGELKGQTQIENPQTGL